MREYLRSYLLMTLWQGLKLKYWFPVIVIFQAITGAGTAAGLKYFFPDLTPTTAMYLATGAPTFMILSVGLLLMPAQVAHEKATGTLTYVSTLPVPRLAPFAADLTVWLVVMAPGIVLTLIISSLRYDFALEPSLLVVPAILLAALMATSIGYALSLVSPTPMVASLISNAILLGMFLFSPITIPVSRFPTVLADMHRVLPFKYAADAVRASVTAQPDANLALSFGVLSAWTAVAVVITYAVARRRT